jgi:hypothetical protein
MQVKIRPYKYKCRLNIQPDINVLYNIFKKRLNDDVLSIRFRNDFYYVKQKHIIHITKKYETNKLYIRFRKNNYVTINDNNTLKIKSRKNFNMLRYFLRIMNEHFSLISPPNVYKIIKNSICRDIVNLIMTDLTLIQYSYTHTSRIFIQCKYSTKIDLDTVIVPSQFSYKTFFDSTPVCKLYKYNHINLYIYDSCLIVISNLQNFSEAENTLALVRQTTFV